MIEGAKSISIKRPSPRVLGKLKKGMKVRICPAMEGEGISLEIHPERFDTITRTFSRGKGIHFQLSPAEIAHNKGKGLWADIKAGLKESGKIILPAAKALGSKLIDMGAEYAPKLATGALTGLALAAGQPELVPLAAAMGEKLGRKGGEAVKKIAKKKLEEYDPYGTAAPTAANIRQLNAYTGQKMGNLTDAAVGSTLANLTLGQIENLLAKKRASMGLTAQTKYDYTGGQAMSPYAESVPSTGSGLYAGRGEGLFAGKGVRRRRPRQEMSSIGIHGNLVGADMHPALKSQPYSANFQFSSRLPPAYQKFSSGSGMC